MCQWDVKHLSKDSNLNELPPSSQIQTKFCICIWCFLIQRLWALKLNHVADSRRGENFLPARAREHLEDVSYCELRFCFLSDLWWLIWRRCENSPASTTLRRANRGVRQLRNSGGKRDRETAGGWIILTHSVGARRLFKRCQLWTQYSFFLAF